MQNNTNLIFINNASVRSSLIADIFLLIRNVDDKDEYITGAIEAVCNIFHC